MNDVSRHVTIVGRLHIMLNLLSMAMAAFFWLKFDAVFLPVAIALFSIPGLVAGYALIKRYSWARPFGILMSAINLMVFPHGTIVGVYSFWVLFTDDARQLFKAGEPVVTD